jgi:DNA-binding PucR family transcriptional regulator
LLRQLAVEQERSQPDLATSILDRLRGSVPEFFADEDVAYDMQAAVRANADRFRHLLSHAPARMSEQLPVEAADLLQSTIQNGIPLISLLEAYRAAQGLALDWWQSRLEQHAPPALLPLAARTLSELILTYVDTAASEIRASYEEQRRTLDNSPEGRRAHLIRRLLAGEPLDIDAAARTLNHPLTAYHLGLVLWRTGDQATHTPFADVLDTILAALGPVRALTMPETRQRSYAWLSTSARLDPVPLRDLRIPDDVRVGASAVHTGSHGFVQAHLEAVRTATIIRERHDDNGRIASYEQIELVALLSRDIDARDRFLKRVLGPLAYATPDALRARETLRVFLACGSSPTRAARQLGVHRNTITYRLNTLAGIAVADDPHADWDTHATHRLELELALHLIEQLGPLARPRSRP